MCDSTEKPAVYSNRRARSDGTSRSCASTAEWARKTGTRRARRQSAKGRTVLGGNEPSSAAIPAKQSEYASPYSRARVAPPPTPTLLIPVGGGGTKVTFNVDSVTWTRDDANGGDRDDIYFDVGFQDDAFGPGQRVGISYRSLAIALDNDSDADHGAAVLELSFWQGF